MSVTILKPVKLSERKPIEEKPYIVEFFSGTRRMRWWKNTNASFRRAENVNVQYWFTEIELPNINEIGFIVDTMIPAHTHPREKELILQGARMAADYLQRLIQKA